MRAYIKADNIIGGNAIDRFLASEEFPEEAHKLISHGQLRMKNPNNSVKVKYSFRHRDSDWYMCEYIDIREKKVCLGFHAEDIKIVSKSIIKYL